MIENLTVTKDGQIQNKLTGNWLKGDVNNAGYRRVQVNRKRYFIHRLVATVYVPNPDNLPQVNHKDGNKLNNHYTNLEWCSASENQLHKCFVLDKTTGSQHTNSKLREQDVLKIRKCFENGESGRSLAKRYGISQTMIRNILAHKSWKHI